MALFYITMLLCIGSVKLEKRGGVKMSEERDHKDNNAFSLSLTLTMALVCIFIACLFLVVLLVNRSKVQNDHETVQSMEQENVINTETGTVADIDHILSGEKRTPADLDFWDKYPEKTSEEVAPTPEPTSEPKEDPSTDGKHTLVVKDDGKEEWVLINQYLPKHEYDFTRLVCQSDLMKYYSDGRLVSFVGIDVSKLQDYIDYTKVKKAGIDYVMVRVGARGYSSGQLVLDDYYSENIKRAADAGLQVGVYFFSQAVDTQEAVEEAKLVIEAIKDYSITYPVAFYMDGVSGDTSRIDRLTRQERTSIAKAYLDTVAQAGYIPLLYGDKECLIKQLDLSKLTAYDVWLSQLSDIPDYPYKFSMWQYSTKGSVDGISGYVNMNISFLDFTEK